MKDRTRKCLEWLKKENDLTFLSIDKIIEMAIDWAEVNISDDMYKRIKAKQEAEEKQKREEETRDDYTIETEDNGRVWYVFAHGHKQRPDSRVLKQGDLIKYDASCPDNGSESGFMIVDSFDYENDFVARSFVSLGTHVFRDRNTGAETVYKSSFSCGGTPGMHKFSFATEDEKIAFFSEMKEKHFDDYLFHFKSNRTPDYINAKYGKYIYGEKTWESEKPWEKWIKK